MGLCRLGYALSRVPQPGAAVTAYQKLADAAQVHKFTGVAPSVACILGQGG